MLDRSAILRDADKRARWLQHHERYRSPARRVYASYRFAFALSLREAWRGAKEQAAYAVRAAALAAEDAAAAALPADVARRISDLLILAGVQPLTSLRSRPVPRPSCRGRPHRAGGSMLHDPRPEPQLCPHISLP